MRKRTFLEIFDNCVWYMLGLLPILYTFFSCVIFQTNGVTIQTFDNSIMSFFGNVDFSNNAIYIVLNGIFGTNDYNVFCSTQPFLYCITFFATVQVMHFFVDICLCVFRLFNKLMCRIGVA